MVKNTDYVMIRHGTKEKRWEAMKKFLQTDKQLNILDIGCNTGYFALAANEMGHNVLGFDLDNFCIELANEKAIEENRKDLKFITLKENILEHLKKYESNSFDYVFYLSVHHHIYEQMGTMANKVLYEISRISKNMFFEMGQKNEINNGYLTWKPHIPDMPNPEKCIISHNVISSLYVYGEIITSTTIHGIERLLFIFNKKTPDYLSAKTLTINNKTYHVDHYIIKNKGSGGKLIISDVEFLTNIIDMETRRRYYLVHDDEDKQYFIKESLYTPQQDYLEYTQKEYDRGQKIKHIKNTLPAIDIDHNFLVFDFFSLEQLDYYKFENVPKNTRQNILNSVFKVFDVLGSLDMNTNNVLYKNGEYRIIDFEPAKSLNDNWEQQKKAFKNLVLKELK